MGSVLRLLFFFCVDYKFFFRKTLKILYFTYRYMCFILKTQKIQKYQILLLNASYHLTLLLKKFESDYYFRRRFIFLLF